MTDQDKILNFLRVTGPTLPVKVAKNINSQILIASAHLSDLASQGKVKISRLKIGGSPLYYLPGQEEQLFNFAEGNSNPKDYQILLNLKDKKVLRESSLELLAKVALREMKDFAIPLQVTIGERAELFWKWHLLSEEETNQLIGESIQSTGGLLESKSRSSTTELAEKVISFKEPSPEPLPESRQEHLPQPSNSLSNSTLNKESFILEEQVYKSGLMRQAESPQPMAGIPGHKSIHQVEVARPREKNELFEETQPATFPEIHSENQIVRAPHPFSQHSLVEEGKSLLKKVKEKVFRRKSAPDEFLMDLDKFFAKLKINIEQKEMIRKNAEFDLIVKIPSVVGETTYFCKAKNKAKCDEKDLSLAYMKAQMKKLPLLFIYTNEIHKKAQEMVDSGAFDNVIVKKMENK